LEGPLRDAPLYIPSDNLGLEFAGGYVLRVRKSKTIGELGI